jgi:methylphosphotriester-DNA--protein-cysteine methyltransferase
MNLHSMFYREVAPAAEISRFVLSFWEFVVGGESSAPAEHEIFPDGCVSLFYHRNEKFNLQKVSLSGLHLETIKVPVFAGDVFWGMRLSPAACARILRSNPSEFQTRNVYEAKEFPHLTENLPAKLEACRNFTEAVGAYEKLFRELNFQPEDFDKKVAEAVEIIEENKGEIKIAELAEAINLSQRQLERRFRNSSGLTPKQYARARRLRDGGESGRKRQFKLGESRRRNGLCRPGAFIPRIRLRHRTLAEFFRRKGQTNRTRRPRLRNFEFRVLSFE